MPPSQSERAIHRAEVKAVLDWLKSDLFVEERCEHEGVRAFRNPADYVVYVKPRERRDGLSGWITQPNGNALVVSSRIDVQTLEEYLP